MVIVYARPAMSIADMLQLLVPRSMPRRLSLPITRASNVKYQVSAVSAVVAFAVAHASCLLPGLLRLLQRYNKRRCRAANINPQDERAEHRDGCRAEKDKRVAQRCDECAADLRY